MQYIRTLTSQEVAQLLTASSARLAQQYDDHVRSLNLTVGSVIMIDSDQIPSYETVPLVLRRLQAALRRAGITARTFRVDETTYLRVVEVASKGSFTPRTQVSAIDPAFFDKAGD